MGYFTFTDAAVKSPRKDRYGMYRRSDKICNDGYGGFCKVVCPDDTEIPEPCYHGYGMFGSHDIYELVVDWNKDHLIEIFQTLEQKDPGTYDGQMKQAAACFQNDDGVGLQEEIRRLGTEQEYLLKEWKRVIGISISCHHNEWLPFPIKITSKAEPCRYRDLYPSRHCQ